MLKSHLSLEGCQAGYTRSIAEAQPQKEGAQAHHLALCLVAYLILERERIDQGITWRQLRRTLIVTQRKVPLPSLKRV